MRCQLKSPEPVLEGNHWHLYKVGDASSTNLHIFCLWLQTGTMTLGASCLTSVSGHHHTVLYLVLVLLYHVKE